MLLHGWACSRRQWAAQIPVLARHYNVVNIDLPGHGGADAPAPDETSIEALAGYSGELLRALGVTDFIVVGHSMGAAVAVEMARRGSGALRAVVALDGLVHLGLYEPQPPEAVAAAEELLADEYEPAVTRMFAALIPSDARRLTISELMSTCSLPDQAVGIALYQGLLAWDMGAALEATRVPVAVICASRTLTDEFRTRYGRGLDISPVAGVGHFLPMEEPAAVNPLLLGTIDSLARTSAGA